MATIRKNQRIGEIPKKLKGLATRYGGFIRYFQVISPRRFLERVYPNSQSIDLLEEMFKKFKSVAENIIV